MRANSRPAFGGYRRRLFWNLGSVFMVALSSFGQGVITFDGPPVISAGSAITVQTYMENGVRFTPLGSSFGFDRIGVNPRAERPDNGTAYLQAALTESLQFSFTNGSSFNMVTVDLAEYSTVVPNAVTVTFYGYRADGSVVFTSFTTDGIIDGAGPLADFQTFHFGPEFSNLLRVEIPTYGWSLDNLVVAVPEPGLGALLLAGVGGRWFFRRRTFITPTRTTNLI